MEKEAISIDSYKVLISNLPVREQSFITKRTTWTKAEKKKEIAWLEKLNDKLFEDKAELTISRQDIFDTIDLRERIIKTIYWGYSSGMRGNHFVNILRHIDEVENELATLTQISRPTQENFHSLASTFKDVTGLGLSTYSKLLYFSNITFNDNPCLILDQRLIDVFSSRTYSELLPLNGVRYENAEKKYLDFLHLINQLSKKLITSGENIELFLFTFGKNLKQ